MDMKNLTKPSNTRYQYPATATARATSQLTINKCFSAFYALQVFQVLVFIGRARVEMRWKAWLGQDCQDCQDCSGALCPLDAVDGGLSNLPWCTLTKLIEATLI